MFNLLLIYDDLNDNNGDYFKASHEHIIDKLSDLEVAHLQSLNTEQCLANPIEHYSGRFNGQPFVFMAYTHGSEDALHIGNERYIHEHNAYFFSESLFYACSCLSAKTLGLTLRQQGCRIFAGYDATISTVNPDCEHIFYECENAFLSRFLTTTNTIQESLSFMYHKYEEMRMNLIANYGVFTSSVLDENLKAFKLFCTDEDRALTNNHFIVQAAE
jgi:hypothetical protein